MKENIIIKELKQWLSEQDIFVKSYDVENKIQELVEKQKFN